MINPIFPKTRYQGSKYKLREWIKEELNKLEFNSCLDSFSGTSSIAYLLKDMGKIVYTNDILNFNYYIAKALNREDGTPSIEEISKILKDIGKVVEIKTMDYKYVLSKKQNIKEVLIMTT
jgi:adenine-specific DNA methylase